MIVFYAGFVCQRVPAGRSDELTKEGVAAGGFRLKFGVKLEREVRFLPEDVSFHA